MYNYSILLYMVTKKTCVSKEYLEAAPDGEWEEDDQEDVGHHRHKPGAERTLQKN